MKRVYFFLGVIGIVLPAVAGAQSANPGDVVINEIAWMGSTTSSSDEWMELYNTTGASINLDGWTLKSTDGKIKAALSGNIQARGFYLLERTNDDSVPNVSADTIYKGGLSNAGQSLKLYDSASTIIDEVNASHRWPAGNSLTHQTMERMGTTWQTSKSPNGTPKAANSMGALATVAAPKPAPKTLPKAKKSDNTTVIAAAVSQPLLNSSSEPLNGGGGNPWMLFIIALSLTAACAAALIIIKIFFRPNTTP